MQPNEVTFALLGIVQVFAGVMILVGFAPFMAGWLGKRKFFLKTLGPVVPVALAHPALATKNSRFDGYVLNHSFLSSGTCRLCITI